MAEYVHTCHYAFKCPKLTIQRHAAGTREPTLCLDPSVENARLQGEETDHANSAGKTHAVERSGHRGTSRRRRRRAGRARGGRRAASSGRRARRAGSGAGAAGSSRGRRLRVDRAVLTLDAGDDAGLVGRDGRHVAEGRGDRGRVRRSGDVGRDRGASQAGCLEEVALDVGRERGEPGRCLAVGELGRDLAGCRGGVGEGLLDEGGGEGGLEDGEEGQAE